MQFNPYEIGHAIAMEINVGLAKAYGTVAAFLHQFPDMQASRNQEAITPEFLRGHVQGFAAGRQSRGPVIPRTIPDERIKDILEVAYHVPSDMLEDAIRRHMEAMGAENFIGWILESYIASEAEPLGWVWCSGAIVRSVDFICPMDGGNWRMLQVKNRSNSENSSSSKVRQGTSIEKWFRIYAYNGKTNWDTFPDPELRTKLSEESFRTYIIDYFSRRP